MSHILNTILVLVIVSFILGFIAFKLVKFFISLAKNKKMSCHGDGAETFCPDCESSSPQKSS